MSKQVVGQFAAKRWFTVTGTTEAYPTNGAGGSTTTAGSSELVSATDVIIHGVAITQVGSTPALDIEDHAGNTLIQFETIGAAAAPYYIPLDIRISSGFRAVWGATGSKATIFYSHLA